MNVLKGKLRELQKDKEVKRNPIDHLRIIWPL